MSVYCSPYYRIKQLMNQVWAIEDSVVAVTLINSLKRCVFDSFLPSLFKLFFLLHQ